MDAEAQDVPSAAPAGKARIFAAMAEARGFYPEIIKNRVATVKHDKGQYSYKYADLSDVFTALDPIMSKYGLTVMQFPAGNDLVTVIGHSSGEMVQSSWPIKAMKGQDTSTAQTYQAAVQVAKRYALTALLGVSTEETVEGDTNKRIVTDTQMNDRFETGDGVRMPSGAKFTKNMSAREKAVEAARAIMDQFSMVKTGKGMSGAWDRNAMFIDLLAEKHDDLYQNILDAFNSRMERFSDESDQEVAA